MKKIDFQSRNLRIFLAYIARQKRLFAIDMVCAVLVAAVDLIFPYASRQAMRQLLPERMFRAFSL